MISSGSCAIIVAVIAHPNVKQNCVMEPNETSSIDTPIGETIPVLRIHDTRDKLVGIQYC